MKNRADHAAHAPDDRETIRYYKDDVFGKSRVAFTTIVLSPPWVMLIGITSDLPFPTERFGWAFGVAGLMVLGTWLYAITGTDSLRNVFFQLRRLADLFMIAWLHEFLVPYGLLISIGICLWFNGRVLTVLANETKKVLGWRELLL